MLFVGGRQDSAMNSSETILFTISTVLYVVTMFFVMRMASDVRDRRPWLVLFAALFALTTAQIDRLRLTPERHWS